MTTIVVIGIGVFFGGILGAVLLWWGSGPRSRPRSRLVRRGMRSLAMLLVVVGLAPVAYLIWSSAGDRSPRNLIVADHITYERMVVDDAVVHWATIDLAGGVGCLEPVVTVPGPNGLVAAQTATGFVADTGSSLAVNVAFFYPITEYPHWSSYPTIGDEITALGYVVDEGVQTGIAWESANYFMIRPADASVEIGELPSQPPEGLWAVPGRVRVVADGKTVDGKPGRQYPRAVAGFDSDHGLLHLVVVDGKQPGYSTGLNLPAVGRALVANGVDEAVEFDGGGSSTMAATIDGEVTLLSRPSHTRIPGRERPVATFLGFRDSCS